MSGVRGSVVGVVGEAAEFNLWHRISSRARAALPTFKPHTFARHTTFILPAAPHIYHIEGGRMVHSYIMVTRLPLTPKERSNFSHISHYVDCRMFPLGTLQSHMYTFSYIPR